MIIGRLLTHGHGASGNHHGKLRTSTLVIHRRWTPRPRDIVGPMDYVCSNPKRGPVHNTKDTAGVENAVVVVRFYFYFFHFRFSNGALGRLIECRINPFGGKRHSVEYNYYSTRGYYVEKFRPLLKTFQKRTLIPPLHPRRKKYWSPFPPPRISSAKTKEKQKTIRVHMKNTYT